MVNLRPLTPHIMPSYTYKMANASCPQILWRHFTLCIDWYFSYSSECYVHRHRIDKSVCTRVQLRRWRGVVRGWCCRVQTGSTTFSRTSWRRGRRLEVTSCRWGGSSAPCSATATSAPTSPTRVWLPRWRAPHCPSPVDSSSSAVRAFNARPSPVQPPRDHWTSTTPCSCPVRAPGRNALLIRFLISTLCIHRVEVT